MDSEQQLRIKTLVNECQNEGNSHYYNNNFYAALQSFSNSITCKRSTINYSKRALVFLKMDLYKKSLEDIQCAIKLQQNFTEAKSEIKELKEFRKFLMDIMTLNKLPTIPEEEIMVFDDEKEAIFLNVSDDLETSILNLSDEDDFSERKFESNYDTEITLDILLQRLSLIDNSDDDDDSNSTLTDNTLQECDFSTDSEI